MYKTQSNQIRQLSKDQYNLLRKMCWHSARLYNFGLYSVRQNFFETKTYLPYPQNYHYCKTNENYQILPSVIGQQTLKVVDRSFKSFFGLLKAKKKGKYQNRISIPKYLPKEGYFQLVIPKNGFQIKGDKIHIGISRQLKEETGLKHIVLDFPTQIKKESVQEIRIIPQQKATFFKMEVVYEIEENFVQVPFGYLMSMLESKCQEYGLKYLEIQESHTSKCSAIDNEEIKHHDEYVGKRVKRGLFKSKDGILINADVNSAINIARKSKVTGMREIANSLKGIVAFPKRIRIANK